MKKCGKVFLLCICLFSFALLLYGCTSPEKSDGMQTISVRLPIPVVDGAFGALYIAQDKGFFEKYGLDVHLEPGSPELNPTKMVDQQVDDIGIAGGPELFMTARDRGAKIKAFALLHKNSNFSTLLVKKGSAIMALEGLEGKKVGFFYGHISTDILRALFSQEGISVEEIDVGFNYQLLIDDQIDAQRAFTTTAGLTLPAQGVAVRQISPASYGIQTDGYTFFAHEATIAQQPELLRKFTMALQEATEYSLRHVDETRQSVQKRDQNLQASIISQQLEIYNKAIQNNTPILSLDESTLQRAKQRLVQQDLLSEEFDIDAALHSLTQ